MLARVDLHLQPKRSHWRDFRLEPVEQCHTAFGTRALGQPEPMVEPFPHRVQDGSNRARCSLHQVDVLGVSAWRLNEQLVELRAATQGDLPRQRRFAEQFDQRAREHKILLYLSIICPGHR